MRHNAKLLLVVLLLLGFNLKQWAQTPYRQYANDGVEMNFFEIQSINFRAYLLYNLTQDNRFELTAEDENGILIINSSNDLSREDFFDTFEDFYNNAYTNFELLSKLEISTQYTTLWKSEVDPRLYSSIMMDIILLRSREGDNETCINADPFCTSDFYEFDAADTDQTADQLEGMTLEDGCIGSSYNPSWYYLRIADPGQLIIHMEGHDPDDSSITRDVDFCMWGPFTEEQVASGYACTHLTTDKIIDCDYSYLPTADAYLGYQGEDHSHPGGSGHGTVNYHVPQTGEYYLLMITNFSREPCVIDFNKEEGSGPGTTDCSILPPIVDNDGPYCVGETIHLTAIGVTGASYTWTGPGNYRSRYQNPSRTNCTMAMAGPYICTITKNGQSACDTTWVEIYPNAVASFTASATTVCVGNPVQFNSTSTTNPTGYTIPTTNWDFGDGQTGSGTSASHTFNATGTYTVTLSVATEGGYCTDSITQTINVSEGEEIFYDPVNECQPYTWTEGNGQTYSEPGTYNVDYTDTSSDCPIVKHITITIADVVTEEVSQTECDSYTWTEGNGETYTTSGNYTWNTTTAEGCPKTVTLHLTINQSEEVNLDPVTECDEFVWNGQTITESGTYDHETTNEQGCQRIEHINVTINHSDEVNLDPVTECDEFVWNGQTITESGTYDHETTTPEGCQRIEHINVTINHSDEVNLDPVTECDEFVWNGQTITESGTYDHETTNEQGCQRIEHITVTINHSDEVDLPAVTECDSYTWNGQTITQSGTYDHETTTPEGCQRIEHLAVTINYSDEVDLPAVTECDSYTWNGQTITQSGTYDHETTTPEGCQRIELGGATSKDSDEVAVAAVT